MLTQMLGYENVKFYDGSAQQWVLTNDMELDDTAGLEEKGRGAAKINSKSWLHMSIKMVEPGRSAIFVRGHIYSNELRENLNAFVVKNVGKGKKGEHYVGCQTLQQEKTVVEDLYSGKIPKRVPLWLTCPLNLHTHWPG